MIHKLETWYDDKGRMVQETIPVDPNEVPDDFKPYSTMLTLTLNTPQGPMEAMRKRVKLHAISLAEAFNVLDGIVEKEMPIMQKEFEAEMRRRAQPKIEVPSGFIANHRNNGTGAEFNLENRMKFPT